MKRTHVMLLALCTIIGSALPLAAAPVAIDAWSDKPTPISTSGGEKSLQTMLDTMFGAANASATTNQVSAGLWGQLPANVNVPTFYLLLDGLFERYCGPAEWQVGGTCRNTSFDFREVLKIDPPAPVPEPGTMLLVGSGLVAVMRRVRRRPTPVVA